MPTVNLNKNVVEKLVGKRLSLERLKDRISYLGTDLESIKGNEISVEVFPNRPDMLSEQGFARALSSFIGVKKGLRRYNVKKSNEKVIIDKSVKNVRPYTACAIVKGLMFNDEKIKEIIQIQEKLHITYGRNRKKVAIGIYPFEKIKTPIRFLARNPKDIRFRPLEYGKKLNGLQILDKHSAGKEYGDLLKGMKKFPIFVDANDNILSMPPIINSHETGKINEKTKDVFIECSGFDFSVLSKCLNIIVTALADMGGIIYSMELKYNKKVITPNLNPVKMKIDLKYVNRILGLNLKEGDLKKYLERMGYGYENKNVLVPSYRADILHQIDLVEDIAIAYGYENFDEEIPKVATIAEEDGFERFKNKIANILVGFGLIECSTYHLSNLDVQKTKMNCGVNIVELENALTSDYNVLRAWMIPSLLDVLKSNKHHDYPQNIFDIGVIFKRDKEDCRVGVILCKGDFTGVKQIFDGLFSELGLKYSIKETEHESFIKGRVGRVSVKGKDVAYIGEIHPKVLVNFDIDMGVAAFELNLSELYKLL